MKAFTLVEMLIVLLIMGVITMMTMGFTGNQLEKLQQKTIKEAMLTDYQSHYTKNLTSSRYAGKMYTEMEISFTSGDNKITYTYFFGDDNKLSETLSDKFQISRIYTNPDASTPGALWAISNLSLTLKPYQGFCTIKAGSEAFDKIVIVTKIREKKQYCFTISSQLCRMVEEPCQKMRTREYEQ